VDENGRIHYGDKPGNNASEKLNIQKSYTTNPIDVKQESRRQRLLDVMKEERQAKREQQEEAQKQAKTKKTNCNRAKKQLASIENSSYLMEKTNDPYNPKILTDAERQTATKNAQKAVNYWCYG
jgi:hypothetical protein